jgi:hypothetical protein
VGGLARGTAPCDDRLTLGDILEHWRSAHPAL